MTARPHPFVSVIVPVFNDPDRIRTCIEALLAQSYPCERYEVIIVDNGSTDDTRRIVRQYPVVSLIEDRLQGSYAARNKGLGCAKGEILAFTDSDCIPRKDWLERGVACLTRMPECTVLGGSVELFLKNPARPTIAGLYDQLWGFPQQRYVEAGFAPTANLFTRRCAFEIAGPFNSQLKSGGDREWGLRATAYGFQVVYARDAVVRHPARESLGELCAKARRVIGGNRDRSKAEASFKHSVGYLLGNLKGLPWRMYGVWTDKRVPSIRRKSQLIFVVLLLFAVRNGEWIRLQLGGTSRRS